MDDDIGFLDVERAVAEREGADFNAGFAFDVQRLGAHGLGNGIELDGAAVFFRLVVAFACAFTAGHDLRRGGLDGGRGKRDRADGDVAALDRLGGVGVRDVLDCKLVGFNLDGIVVGLLERLKLLFVHLAEELFKLRGVVVLRPVVESELFDFDVFSAGVSEAVDSFDGSLDKVRELFNLEGRRHLEGRRGKREAAERQGRRIAMAVELVSLGVCNFVVFNNLELGVVVDRDVAELGDIPGTILRFGIAFGAGLGSGCFYFPFSLVAGERDGALMVVAVVDLAVLTLLEGLSLAEDEGGAGGEVLVFVLGEVERAVVSEGAHDEALVDGELAASGHGNEVADLGGVAGVIAVLEVVGGEGTLVADGDGLFLLGVDGAPGGLAVDLGRAGTSILGDGELGAAVKSAFGVDELAAGLERDIAVTHASARFGRLVVFAFLLVGFGLELVALVIVREGGVLERDVAHDDGGGGGLKVVGLVEAVDRHVRLVVGVSARDFDRALGVVEAAVDPQIVFDFERARVDEGAGDRDRLVGFERAVVDERAAFSDVKADVERQAGKFVGELAGSLVGLVLADRDLVTVLALDRDLAGGVREVLVEGLGPVFVPGLFVLDGVGDGVGSGTDGQRDVLVDRLGHGACGEDGERGQDGRDERLPGEGGVAH